jgi:hypothetical protein
MKSFYILVGIFVISFTMIGLAQQEIESHEIKWDVPELFAFHEVIYPIWHTAFPNKDIQMLKGFVDEVNDGAEKIFKVELPGILRDKEGKWTQGVEKFKASVDLYNKAAEGDDDKAMLDAAEKLHSDFEMLVRIIKPMSKEIDEYHQTLYMIYHYYYPEKDYLNLKAASSELHRKAGLIKSADIPRRAQSVKEKYIKIVDELIAATQILQNETEKDNFDHIDKLVENVHTKYQELEQLFD